MKKILLPLVLMVVTASAHASYDYSFSYSPVDLGSPQAIEKLHKNIKQEARTHCMQHRTTGLREVRECLTDVVEDIVSQINDSRLTSWAETGAHRATAAG